MPFSSQHTGVLLQSWPTTRGLHSTPTRPSRPSTTRPSRPRTPETPVELGYSATPHISSRSQCNDAGAGRGGWGEGLTFPTFWQHCAPPPVLQSLEDVAVGVAVTVTVCVGSSQSGVGGAAAAESARAVRARMRVGENIFATVGVGC